MSNKNSNIKIWLTIIALVSVILLIVPTAKNYIKAVRLNSVIESLETSSLFPGVNRKTNKEGVSCYASGSKKDIGPHTDNTCITKLEITTKSTSNNDQSIEQIRDFYTKLISQGWYPRGHNTSNYDQKYNHQLVPQAYYTELNKNYSGGVKCDLEGEFDSSKSEYNFEASCFYKKEWLGLDFSMLFER